MALISTLTDNFNDNSIDTTKWDYGSDVAEVNNNLEFTSTLSADSSNLYSKTTYNLTGSQITIKLVDAGNQSLASWAFTPLWAYLDGTHSLLFRVKAGNLEVNDIARSNNSPKYSVTYNATNHRYLRIREASGTIYWDCSANGTSWTNLYNEANPFAVTALEVDFGGEWEAEASTTTAKVDDFNILPDSTVLDRTNCKLLAHFNGANGATTYTSDDANARTATFAGSAQLSTTQKVFGTASLLLAYATSDYLTFPDSDDWAFGTGDFELSLKTYFNSLPSSGDYWALLNQFEDNGNFWSMEVSNSSGTYKLTFSMRIGWANIFAQTYDCNPNLTTGNWNTFTISRTGGRIYLFQNGNLLGSFLDSSTFPNFVAPITIGMQNSGEFLDAYNDEAYILVGQALHTADYEPPTEEYSLSSATTRRRVIINCS